LSEFDVNSEVISEKALRYKRNALLISFVLIVVEVIPGLELSGIPLLGTALKDIEGVDDVAKNSWAWGIAFVVLFYNTAYFVWHGTSSFLNWMEHLLHEKSIPKLSLLTNNIYEGTSYTITEKLDPKTKMANKTTWTCKKITHYDNGRTGYLFVGAEGGDNQVMIYDVTRDNVRRLFKAAYRFDVGLPLIIICIAAFLTFVNIYNGVTEMVVR
jgi:hypothetical protein